MRNEIIRELASERNFAVKGNREIISGLFP